MGNSTSAADNNPAANYEVRDDDNNVVSIDPRSVDQTDPHSSKYFSERHSAAAGVNQLSPANDNENANSNSPAAAAAASASPDINPQIRQRSMFYSFRRGITNVFSSLKSTASGALENSGLSSRLRSKKKKKGELNAEELELEWRNDSLLPNELVLTDILKRIVSHWKLRNSELIYFFKEFQKLDTDGSGTIEQVEFFLFLREPRTRVLNYVMPIIVHMDVDQLHFSAWMTAIFGFCFLTEREVLEHIFSKYDSTRTGKLLEQDIFKFVKHMHADNPLFPKDIVVHLADALKANGGFFDFSLFVTFAKRYPMFTYPIYRIQEQMRHRVIGIERFWELDKRSGDVYGQRAVGDRPRDYYKKKFLLSLRIWFCWFPCCLGSPEEREYSMERRRELKRLKTRTIRRRLGNVLGDDHEEKKLENAKLRKLKKLHKKNKKLGSAASNASSAGMGSLKRQKSKLRSLHEKIIDGENKENNEGGTDEKDENGLNSVGGSNNNGQNSNSFKKKRNELIKRQQSKAGLFSIKNSSNGKSSGGKGSKRSKQRKNSSGAAASSGEEKKGGDGESSESNKSKGGESTSDDDDENDGELTGLNRIFNRFKPLPTEPDEILDEFDSDGDIIIDEFEDYILDEYADARPRLF